MKEKTKRELEKHQTRLKYLKLQKKKINSQMRCEIMAIKRMTDAKSKKYQSKKPTGVKLKVSSL